MNNTAVAFISPSKAVASRDMTNIMFYKPRPIFFCWWLMDIFLTDIVEHCRSVKYYLAIQALNGRMPTNLMFSVGRKENWTFAIFVRFVR